MCVCLSRTVGRRALPTVKNVVTMTIATTKAVVIQVCPWMYMCSLSVTIFSGLQDYSCVEVSLLELQYSSPCTNCHQGRLSHETQCDVLHTFLEHS